VTCSSATRGITGLPGSCTVFYCGIPAFSRFCWRRTGLTAGAVYRRCACEYLCGRPRFARCHFYRPHRVPPINVAAPACQAYLRRHCPTHHTRGHPQLRLWPATTASRFRLFGFGGTCGIPTYFYALCLPGTCAFQHATCYNRTCGETPAHCLVRRDRISKTHAYDVDLKAPSHLSVGRAIRALSPPGDTACGNDMNVRGGRAFRASTRGAGRLNMTRAHACCHLRGSL